MIFGYLFFAFLYLRQAVKKLGKVSRANVYILILLAAIGMVCYELYVEYAVGWAYGIPYDDDTGWVFRSAKAMSEGIGWNQLYRLTMHSWNMARVLSVSTVGQYVYATIVCGALFFPTVFDLHINLYLFYFFQILIAAAACVNFLSALRDYVPASVRRRRVGTMKMFFLLLFYPIVLFNTYKLLRETFFIVFMLEDFSFFVRVLKGEKKRRAFYLLSILLLIVRPNAALYVLPMIIWDILGERIALIANISITGLLLIGLPVLTFLAGLVGIPVELGTANISNLIYLILFPNPINQFQNFINLGKEPSWVTLLYFPQSLWNIPIVYLTIVGVVRSLRAREDFFWFLAMINTALMYSISGMGLTPRYKLIYMVPQFLFLYIALSRAKGKRTGNMISNQ